MPRNRISARGGARIVRPAVRLVHASARASAAAAGGDVVVACSSSLSLALVTRLLPRVGRRRRCTASRRRRERPAPVRGRRRARRAARSGTPSAGSAAWSTRSPRTRSCKERDRAAAPAGDRQRQSALRENAQLQAAARLPRRARRFPQDYRPVAARVIAPRAEPVRAADRRSPPARTHGVSRHDPVVTADGLVGQVTKVASSVAQVTLLTDETSAVSALDLDDERAGIVAARAAGSDALDPRPRDEGPGRRSRATSSSPPAGAPASSRRSTRAGSRSAASRASARPTRTSTSRSRSTRSSTSRRSTPCSSLVPKRKADDRRARRRSRPARSSSSPRSCRSSVFSRVTSLGGTPDLLLVTLVCVALLRGPIVGAVAGFCGGLLVDTANLGRSASPRCC